MERPKSRLFRLARLLIVAGLSLLALWLALSVLQLVSAGRSLLERQQRFETLLDAGILNADAQELEHIVLTVNEDIGVIRRVGGPFAAAGRYLGWLPTVGPVLADSGNLLDMADAGSEMATFGIAALKPLLSREDSGTGAQLDSLPTIITVLDTAEPRLLAADRAGQRMFDARAKLEHESEYPRQLAEFLLRLDENAVFIRDGLKLSLIAPELLGLDRPRSYLILAQNEDELRPAGGFISGAGRLTVDQGQIVGLSFENANLVDDWQNKPYDLPPAPFTKFMGMDIFLFRDANFWPDFGQSAAQAQALYTYGQDVPLDGVVAIDQRFLQQLLAITGPLPVPVLDRVVDANSVVEQLREEWGPTGEGDNWIVDRKAFMAPLAEAFRAQIDSGLLAAKGLELVEMLQSAAEERHLQLYSSDPQIAVVLEQTSWSGRMGPIDATDFVHVSDTNMGFNKVNSTVDRSLSYHVILDDTLGHSAQLDIQYNNPPAVQSPECVHGTPYDPDTQYESLTIDCFWNYVRAFVPGGSELTWSSQHPIPAASLMSGLEWPGAAREQQSDDGTLTTFDNFILLPPGQSIMVSFQYDLPDQVLTADGDKYNYRLHVRKQAGTVAEPVRVRVTLPIGLEELKVSPEPNATDGNTLDFDLQLARDVFVDISFRK